MRTRTIAKKLCCTLLKSFDLLTFIMLVNLRNLVRKTKLCLLWERHKVIMNNSFSNLVKSKTKQSDKTSPDCLSHWFLNEEPRASQISLGPEDTMMIWGKSKKLGAMIQQVQLNHLHSLLEIYKIATIIV